MEYLREARDEPSEDPGFSTAAFRRFKSADVPDEEAPLSPREKALVPAPESSVGSSTPDDSPSLRVCHFIGY